MSVPGICFVPFLLLLFQALAGNNTEPDSVLIEQVDRLYSLFAFYHGSVDQVRLVSTSLC